MKEVVSRQTENINPNLEILADTLREHVVHRGNDTRAIVFVRTRMLAEALSSWLCRCGEDDLMGLNAKKFTSTNAPEELGGNLPSTASPFLILQLPPLPVPLLLLLQLQFCLCCCCFCDICLTAALIATVIASSIPTLITLHMTTISTTIKKYLALPQPPFLIKWISPLWDTIMSL